MCFSDSEWFCLNYISALAFVNLFLFAYLKILDNKVEKLRMSLKIIICISIYLCTGFSQSGKRSSKTILKSQENVYMDREFCFCQFLWFIIKMFYSFINFTVFSIYKRCIHFKIRLNLTRAHILPEDWKVLGSLASRAILCPEPWASHCSICCTPPCREICSYLVLSVSRFISEISNIYGHLHVERSVVIWYNRYLYLSKKSATSMDIYLNSIAKSGRKYSICLTNLLVILEGCIYRSQFDLYAKRGAYP